MIGATITADLKDFKSYMSNLKKKVNDMSPAFDQFGRYMMSETRSQFASQTAPDGSGWAPLKPATLLRKKGRSILRETDEMYNSLYYDASAKSFKFGIKDKKYIFHHTGTSRMAARVVIGINSERLQKRNQLLILFIKRKR